MQKNEARIDLTKRALNFWLDVALYELAKEESRESLVEIALETAVSIAINNPQIFGMPHPHSEKSEEEVKHA
ncbi:MAG: hypothetical protein DSY34_00650 [Desulfurobacterium sp.]|nr:MAG: hypothetical protein DSY34_00650 [Desulfurobacterium sp.]